MKICIIGNSHVASLKQGWESIKTCPDYAHVSVEFFAAPRNTIDQLEYQDGSLFAGTQELKKHLELSSPGKDEIRIEDYDLFVIQGLVSFNRVARTFASGRHSNLDFVRDTLDGSLAMKFHNIIISHGIPALLSTEPMFSETVVHSPHDYGYSAFVTHGLELSEPAESLLLEWKCCIGSRPIVEQPADTVIGSIFTKKEYLNRQGDNLHMNAEFGAMVLANLFAKAEDTLSQRERNGAQLVTGETPLNGIINPYIGLPESSYWKLAVANHETTSVRGLYKRRFSLSGKQIATAGSCFAQEIAKGLRRNGYSVIDKEPSPNTPEVRGELEASYGYKLYSARHGNIYTVRQLLQLTKESLGLVEYPHESYIWTKNGRYYDAFRPSVEPDGLPSAQEVILQRMDHIRRFEAVIREANIFIFTMGLTETWMHRELGVVYPTAPGVIAGEFDPDIYRFHNFSFQETYDDFVEFRAIFKSVNPEAKFLITVSPVPLTATAADTHVLVSTVRSKSILRAVAAQIYEEFDDVDYFPSYELFSTPFLGESQFKDNRRTVKREGVDAVMRIFFEEHGPEGPTPSDDSAAEIAVDSVCEEALLEAFARGDNK